MMNKTALLHEAKQQQQALRQLSLWKRIAMLLSSCAAVLAWWGIAGSGLRFAGGVCGVVIALACAVCARAAARQPRGCAVCGEERRDHLSDERTAAAGGVPDS